MLSMCFFVEIGPHLLSYTLANTEYFSRRLSSHTSDSLLGPSKETGGEQTSD